MRRLRRWRREELLELRDDLVPDVEEEVASHDRQRVLVDAAVSLAKRYVRQEIQVWVRLRIGTLIGDDRYYLVVLNRVSCEYRCGRWGRTRVPTNGGGDGRFCRCGNDDKTSVFVDVVQISE